LIPPTCSPDYLYPAKFQHLRVSGSVATFLQIV
jgi:hypothetical protein